MVVATFALHGTEHLTNYNPCPPKKPTGFRFQFRDATEDTKEQWEDFTDNLKERLDDPDTFKRLGLRHPTETDDKEGSQTQQVDLNKVWEWYSKHLVASGKATLLGKKVGRSGVKPQAEVSLQHIIRSCAKLKERAKRVCQKLPQVDYLTLEDIRTVEQQLWDRIERYNDGAKTPLQTIDSMPETSAGRSMGSMETAH
ncbi:hypothetical protein BGZ65_005032 [Modicella reniformis]|uniref:Uncharacterized protein n=1 Tax=Modicella reniformis TaxID=1440133 RepID=A0A9P6IKT1_9FUNG|nr:hypothetical protein BGZ65_005032 [Modicella reniformis]